MEPQPVELDVAILRVIEKHNRGSVKGDLDGYASPEAIDAQVKETSPHLWPAREDADFMLQDVIMAVRRMEDRGDLVIVGPANRPEVDLCYILSEQGRRRIRGFELT